MVPTKKVKKTLYEVWHGQALKLSYLKSEVVRLLLSVIRLSNLKNLNTDLLSVSLQVTQRKQWVTPSITHREVFVAQNAEFFESSLISQESSGSLEDLEVIQEEDTHHSENTSKHHDEDEQEIDEPQSDVIPVRSVLGLLDTAYWMEIVLHRNVDQSILYNVSADVDTSYSFQSGNGLDLV
ncbi:hypothetical protein Tco_0514302 [Tanacetum coccineum]